MHTGNPHLSCMFLDDSTVVATGYDKIPYAYKKEKDGWKMLKILDEGIKTTRKTKIGGNSFLNKKVYFNSDFKLNANVEIKETNTMHVNFINCLKIFA